jgi:hypothetical protein
MSIVANFEAARGMLPAGLPVSLLGVIATVLIGVVYSIMTQERPLAGFPLASVEGQSPKKSWLFHGRRLVTESLEKVPAARANNSLADY